MSSPAYPLIGVDPDAFCTPDFFDLHSIPFMTRGWLVADYPAGAVCNGQKWKDRVASLALSRLKNKKLTEGQMQKIMAWLERNRVDYPMLPLRQDPRISTIECEWKTDWESWARNACTFLNKGVEAVISAKEPEISWDNNPKWRQLQSTKRVQDCVPELEEEERPWRVKRDAESLASLVAHPLRFGDVLKMIDPHADYERWHPTLDAMLRHANPGIVIELHCSRKIAAGKGGHGPSASFRKAWENWAQCEHSGKLVSFSVFFWEELQPAVVEIHDRHAIIGTTSSNGSQPFAGVSVGKGWDPAPYKERNLETSFSMMSRKDQRLHWRHYSSQSNFFSRVCSEDVLWTK